MARVLVTGASGYIGSHLAPYLVAQGHKVTAGVRTTSSEITRALAQCDVIALDVLTQARTLTGEWDCIIHTATANDVVSKDFRAGLELSALGTQEMLEAAARLGVPQLLYFSTLQVLGTELQGALGEAAGPNLMSPYGFNHHVGELVCQLFSRSRPVATAVLRPANVYGCPAVLGTSRWYLVPLCFIKEAIERGTITIKSSGLQTRDFVSLRQVSAACADLVGRKQSGASVTLTIAGGTTTRVLDVARWVAEVHERVTGRAIRVDVTGTAPAASNEFRVASSITAPPLGSSTEHEMKLEIRKTFELLLSQQPLLRKPSLETP